MNKRDRGQLRASIAKDRVQGQGEHSPAEKQSYDFLLFFTRRRGAGAAAAGVLDGKVQRCRTLLFLPRASAPFTRRARTFVFQAEDGIRYLIVTGVQTC